MEALLADESCRSVGVCSIRIIYEMVYSLEKVNYGKCWCGACILIKT